MDVRGKRLIDAKFAQHIANVELSPDTAGTVQWVLSHTPTVDAVEVVRCRECKYHNKPPCPMRLSFNWTEDDDFCSYGERKEGAN